MRLVFVTGMSGAGKTTALKMLEDAQYFCVDNLPIPLLGKFVSLMSGSRGEDVQNAAIGIDARPLRNWRSNWKNSVSRARSMRSCFWMPRTGFW